MFRHEAPCAFPGMQFRYVMRCHVLHAQGVCPAVRPGITPHPESSSSTCGLAQTAWPMSAAQAPARAAAAGASLSAGIAASSGRGRLPSSFLLLPTGSGSLFPRVSCAGACARRRAYRGGAVRAPDCAREAEGAPLPSASHGFSENGAARPRNARDAAPDAASLGTIITQSARCQAQNTNKKQLY